MKKLFFLGIFALSLAEMRAQAADVNPDSIQKEHNYLMGKANSFFSTYKSGIDSRIKTTERLASKGAQDTSGAKSLIKVYQSDSSYCQMVIPKGDSLMQSLLAHGKRVKETMPRGDLSDKFLSENVEKMDKVEFVIKYAKDIGEQVVKFKKRTNKKLKEMKDEIAKQIAKEEKAKQKKLAKQEKNKNKKKKTKKRRR